MPDHNAYISGRSIDLLLDALDERAALLRERFAATEAIIPPEAATTNNRRENVIWGYQQFNKIRLFLPIIASLPSHLLRGVQDVNSICASADHFSDAARWAIDWETYVAHKRVPAEFEPVRSAMRGMTKGLFESIISIPSNLRHEFARAQREKRKDVGIIITPEIYGVERFASAIARYGESVASDFGPLEGHFTRHISSEVKKQVYARDDGRCVSCGSRIGLQFDHIIPFSLGGNNSAENLQLLCMGCNLKKSAAIQ